MTLPVYNVSDFQWASSMGEETVKFQLGVPGQGGDKLGNQALHVITISAYQKSMFDSYR